MPSIFSHLIETCRSEPDLRLAVLYGSMARGDADSTSDLDLLVVLPDEDPHSAFRFATRLSRVVGCKVDVVRLDRVEETAPLLLARVLDEGKVVIDRDGIWPALCSRRATIEARAERSYQRQIEEAKQAVAELTAARTNSDLELDGLAEYAAELSLDLA